MHQSTVAGSDGMLSTSTIGYSTSTIQTETEERADVEAGTGAGRNGGDAGHADHEARVSASVDKENRGAVLSFREEGAASKDTETSDDEQIVLGVVGPTTPR